jgi:hypothetical protein
MNGPSAPILDYQDPNNGPKTMLSVDCRKSFMVAGAVMIIEAAFFGTIMILIPTRPTKMLCGTACILFAVSLLAGFFFAARGLGKPAKDHVLEIVAIILHIFLLAFNILFIAVIFFGVGD